MGAPRVLIVDDDVALAEMLGLVLRREGFIPSVVTSGSAALAAIRRENPDVVLLDLMLPGRDGVDVCRDLRAESDVPVIMLTARSDTIDIVRGSRSGLTTTSSSPSSPPSWSPASRHASGAVRTSPPCPCRWSTSMSTSRGTRSVAGPAPCR